tara:strand:- start:45690 stop:46184 length:495 start_codon:yes stop_codon:yes gene_type:complete
MSYIELLTAETKQEIDHWLAKYPADKRRSAVLSALHAVQKQNDGWISDDLLKAVAEYLEIPEVWVTEVVTFYDMYDLKPCGQHKIRVCTNISCMLRGAEETLSCVEKRLGVKAGESTKDGKFKLIESECLAACVGAPMMQIDNKYYEHLTEERVDRIISEWENS